MKASLLLLLVPMLAQDLCVVHISDEDAHYLWAAHERKLAADQQWRAAATYAFEKYATEPGKAEAGSLRLPVRSILRGWEYGMDFSDDFAVAAAKRKPEDTASSTTCDQVRSASAEVDTIPRQLWLPPKENK